MKTHWTFRNCESDKEAARSYMESKARRLTRRIARLHSDRSQLELTLYFHSKRDVYELRAVLRTPTGLLMTTDEQRDLRHVIDEVIDDLSRQLRRHKAKVRRERVTRRRRRRLREFAAAAPFLEHDVEHDRRDDFFALLSPLLESVRKHAEYELTLLEEEEALAVGELSVDDVVDEVIVLAFDRFRSRPPDSLLEAWLMELLEERLQDLMPPERPLSLASAESLDSNVGDYALDFEDVNYWMSHVLEGDEKVDLEELIPDESVGDWYREVDDEDKQRQLRRMLNRLPKRQRQAIMLHESSGFEISEIAQMLQISESQVRCLVEKARTKLRRSLAEFQDDSSASAEPRNPLSA